MFVHLGSKDVCDMQRKPIDWFLFDSNFYWIDKSGLISISIDIYFYFLPFLIL